jgi:hypothetical protein
MNGKIMADWLIRSISPTNSCNDEKVAKSFVVVRLTAG